MATLGGSLPMLLLLLRVAMVACLREGKRRVSGVSALPATHTERLPKHLVLCYSEERWNIDMRPCCGCVSVCGKRNLAPPNSDPLLLSPPPLPQRQPSQSLQT